MSARPAGSRRPWAWPLVPLYAAGLAAKDGLRRVGGLGTRRLAWPVVSVGSLSAGGAGKTPVVIALAELLRERGWYVDVLSRGYGRSGSGVERVDGRAKDAALRFGDEPVVMATSARLPVWVGAKRFLAGEAAEAASPAGTHGLHLLDDGFQHRQLERALDMVLVTAEDFDDVLLPAGNLRERWKALRRADAVVMREDEREAVEARVRAKMKPGALLWSVRREPQLPNPEWAGKRAVAFCAIARPEGFLSMLAGAGCPVVKAVVFSDHHPYRMEDVRNILKIAQEAKATGYLITEKDYVKLSELMIGELQSVGPVRVVPLKAKFVDEEDVVGQLEARIR